MTILPHNNTIRQEAVSTPTFSAKSHRHLADIATNDAQRARHLELAKMAEDRARWLDSFLQHLHRGGAYAYYWRPYTTRWYETNRKRPAADPGRDCYFGVHPCRFIPQTNAKGEPKPAHQVRGQTEAISAINCVFAEYDAKDFACVAEMLQHVYGLEPAPSVLIFSSNHGLHAYWLLDEPFYTVKAEDRERAQRLQYAWVERTGGDPGAKDMARVLRLPGTTNTKYSPAEPVRFADYHPERTYTFEELEALARSTRNPDSQQQETKNLVERNSTIVEPPGTATQLQRALAALAPWRVDDYDCWVTGGMAIHDAGLPFDVWDKWSAQGSKYGDDGNARLMEVKWASFTQGRGITIKTVYKWAHEDSPGWHITRQPPTPAVKPTQDATPEAEDESLPERLKICGKVHYEMDPNTGKMRLGRLRCNNHRLCLTGWCTEIKAREIIARLRRALEFGDVHVAILEKRQAARLIRRIGKSNCLAVTQDGDWRVVFNNAGEGEPITQETLADMNYFMALVRAIPEKGRMSGHLGRDPQGELVIAVFSCLGAIFPDIFEKPDKKTRRQLRRRAAKNDVFGCGLQDEKETVEVLSTQIVLDRDPQRNEAARLWQAAFEVVRSKIAAMPGHSAGDVSTAMDMQMTAFKSELQRAGYDVIMQIKKTRRCDLARYRSWIGKDNGLSDTGSENGSARSPGGQSPGV